MNTMKKSPLSLVALFAALLMIVTACGTDVDPSVADGTDLVEEGIEAAEAEEPVADEAVADEAVADEAVADEAVADEAVADEAVADEPVADEAMADGVAVDLGEWFIAPTSDAVAGLNTFAVSNSGDNPHALAIAKGVSYEDLPQLDNGAVDTDVLGDDYLGTGDNLAPGESGSVDFDLPAGDYVFFCPIARGSTSHAGQGQVLSVTVAG